MRFRQWSRRDVSRSIGRIGGGDVVRGTVRAAAPPPASSVTPALIEAARKEGKVSFYTALELNVAERLARDIRGEISGHRRARRALRGGADLPAHRAGAGQRHQCGRCRQLHRSRALSRLEEERLARALSAGGGREAFSGRSGRPRRHLCDLLRLDRGDRLQHRPRQARGCAERAMPTCSIPKWQGKIVKAHPGYSGAIMTATFVLSRDLGWQYLREARAAEGHAGAVGGRSAEEDPARRTRRHGRRQRLQSRAAQGPGQAGRGGLCQPKARR